MNVLLSRIEGNGISSSLSSSQNQLAPSHLLLRAMGNSNSPSSSASASVDYGSILTMLGIIEMTVMGSVLGYQLQKERGGNNRGGTIEASSLNKDEMTSSIKVKSKDHLQQDRGMAALRIESSLDKFLHETETLDEVDGDDGVSPVPMGEVLSRIKDILTVGHSHQHHHHTQVKHHHQQKGHHHHSSKTGSTASSHSK